MGFQIAIDGPAGAGKSTILKLIVGELTPTSGVIYKKNDLNISYLSQDTFLNKDSEEIDLHEIETTLRTYGIFSDIKVTLTETEGDENAETDSKTSVLNISLKEKITVRYKITVLIISIIAAPLKILYWNFKSNVI